MSQSEHLKLDEMDPEKIAKILNQHCDAVLEGKQHVVSSMVFAALGAGGICMCHASEFLGKLTKALDLAIADLRDGKALKTAPEASAVADRLLAELFTRPPQSEQSES